MFTIKTLINIVLLTYLLHSHYNTHNENIQHITPLCTLTHPKNKTKQKHTHYVDLTHFVSIFLLIRTQNKTNIPTYIYTKILIINMLTNSHIFYHTYIHLYISLTFTRRDVTFHVATIFFNFPMPIHSFHLKYKWIQ